MSFYKNNEIMSSIKGVSMLDNRIMFSIIIPVYNVEDYLEECIESVFAQSYKNYEVICVEDCSTDKSKNVLYSIHKKYPCIKVYENTENIGLSASRNRGINIAKGDYICFLDSDDKLADDALSILANKLVKEELDILYYELDYLHEIERDKERSDFWNDCGSYLGIDLFIKAMRANVDSPGACAAVFRTFFLKDNMLKFIDNIFHEDVVFYFESIICAKRVSVINNIIYFYRIREGSITSTVNVKRRDSLIIAVSRMLTIWNKYVGNELLDESISKYIWKRFLEYKRYSYMITNSEKLKDGSPIDNFLHMMVTYKGKGQILLKGFSAQERELLAKAEGVWIYGAGQFGASVNSMLEQIGIYPKGFLVTHGDGNLKYKGYKVYEYSSTIVKDKDVVIIGVGKKYMNQILDVLVKDIPGRIITVSKM